MVAFCPAFQYTLEGPSLDEGERLAHGLGSRCEPFESPPVDPDVAVEAQNVAGCAGASRAGQRRVGCARDSLNENVRGVLDAAVPLGRAGASGEPSAWSGRLRSHVLGEQFLGLMILLAVGVLGTMRPAVGQ